MPVLKSNDLKRPENIDKILKAVIDFGENNEEFIFCVEQKQFYMWEDNYWQAVNDYKFERWLMGQHEPIIYMSQSKRREAIHNLALIKQTALGDMNQGEFLDLDNGVFDIRTNKFMPHDKKMLSTIRIPYKYDKNAKCPNWIAFLLDCLEGVQDRIKTLQEFMGYCLGRDNNFHRALICIGEGRNGKGTTFHIIRRMVGEKNCTALKLRQMMNENFAARLANKLVNIDADTDAAAAGFEADFRTVSAGDTILVKNLYSDPFELTPYTKLVIGANDLPHIGDKTHGIYDRLLILPYNVSYAGREDFNLKEKLEREMSGILNWALEGRRRLYERGRFHESDELREIVRDIKRQNNPIEAFVDERVRTDRPNASIPKNDVYNAYVTWCKTDGYRPLSHIKFSKEFFRVCKDWTRKNVRTGHDNINIWPGLYLNGAVYQNKNQTQEVAQWEE